MRSGRRSCGVAVEAMHEGRRDGRGHRRHRHHQPAGDHHRLGQGDRRADLQRHRLAVPPDRRNTATSCRRAGLTEHIPAEDRPCASTPISPPRRSSGCWIMSPAPARRAERGELLFGTVETWLIWKLTGGSVHVTDYTNASPHHALQHPHARLGRRDSAGAGHPALPCCRSRCRPAAVYGTTDPTLFGGEIPIAGAAGDQQAALFGQTCFAARRGEKHLRHRLLSADEHRRDSRSSSQNGLVTTIAWGLDGKVNYALEGSIFVAGAAIQWLRDELRLLDEAGDSEYYGPEGARTPTAATSSRPSPASARPTGTSTPAARSWASPGAATSTTSSAPRWTVICLSGQRRAPRHGGGLRHRHASPPGGRRRVGQQLPHADPWPTSAASKSSAPAAWKPRRWARPIWPASP